MNTFLTLLYVLSAIGFVLWLHNRPNPAQVIHNYKDLKRQIETEERSLDMALRERWEPAVIASIRQRLAELETRLDALEKS